MQLQTHEKIVAGKSYEKVCLYSLTDERCILADRRMTSIRQQSDKLVSVVSIWSKMYSCMSEESLAAASAVQLCCDRIGKIDRHVFVGQFVNAKLDPLILLCS